MLPRGALTRVEATFVFLGVENFPFIEQECADAARAAFALLARVVRTTLARSRGHEAACGDGSFLFVFPDPECALRGIFTAQRECEALPYAAALECCRHCPTERAPDASARVLFRGLRVCVGLHHGAALTLARRPRRLGRARAPRMYAGDAVLRAYRTACAARGGQVLLTAATHARCTRWLTGTTGVGCTWLGAVDRADAVWEVFLADHSPRVYAAAPAHAGGWIFPRILGSALGAPASTTITTAAAASSLLLLLPSAPGARARLLLLLLQATNTTSAVTITRSTSVAVISSRAAAPLLSSVAVRGADPAHPVRFRRLDLTVLQRPDVRALILETRRELRAASLPPVLCPAAVHHHI